MKARTLDWIPIITEEILQINMDPWKMIVNEPMKYEKTAAHQTYFPDFFSDFWDFP